MSREFEAFARLPTPESFVSARAALLGQSPRPLAATDIAHLLDLLQSDGPHAVSEAIASLPAIAALSPAIHAIAAEAAAAAGDSADHELERYLLLVCLEAILNAGDGSEDSPYLVACTMDERHVCRALGVIPRSQALSNHQGRLLDVVACENGERICFDVTGLVTLPARQPRRTKSADHAVANPRRSGCLAAGRRVSQTRR